MAIALLAVVVSGCVDKYGVPDGYVEVESLRTDQPSVYLSPAGETASFQTNIEILPQNATNRKLVYYVPSEYKGYVQVSESGLITAVQLTPEGEKVPVKVYSSSNPNAYLTINVVVEYVEVKEISFVEESLSLLYNSEGATVTPVFTPSHAQDGRAVTFSSLNSNVATVDANGLVTPVSAGNTHILAVGRTSSGKEITGRIPVVVTYAAGRYRLEVSDSAPQYDQVKGQFKPINFNLMVLDEHSDPNVFIQWYVDSERVVGMDNQPQYQHIPSVSTRTSYKVSAVVSTRMEEAQTFYSELITIHNPFSGYTYNYDNLTLGGYQYGDVVTFELTEGSDDIAEYRWYLSRKGTNASVFVGTTTPVSRNLTRRLNIEGIFVLRADGMSANGTLISSREFDFGVTRYFVGDTLLVNPLLTDDGIPPESYNFYIKAFGDDSADRTDDFSGYDYVSSALQGETFALHLSSAGYYKLASQAMLDGVVAKVDGKEFTLFTDYIRVYSENFTDIARDNDIVDATDADFGVTDELKIHNVTVGGIYDGGYKVLISWDPVRKAGSYVAEIIKDGEIYIIGEGRDGENAFGENYLIVPSEYVTLADKFTVRIKQNGSLFSPTYFYGYQPTEGLEEYYFGTVGEELYPYLVAVDGIYTSYLNNMEQLGQILRYVTTYQPTGNESVAYSVEKIDGTDHNVFTLKLYFAFDLALAAERYPSEVNAEDVAEEFADLYLAVCGAQNAYCPSGIYLYRFGRDGAGYTVTILIPTGGGLLHTDGTEFVKGTSVNYSSEPYGAGYADHSINYRKTAVTVNDGDQLYAAAEKGYLAVAGNDSVRVLYNKILGVVNSVIGPEMSDVDKALAFFDYLTTNVVYDTALEAMTATPSTELYRYAGFRPEGVFDDGRAVCDGIAKAYVILCAIEGIPCVRVTGTVGGKTHSWNKILIDGVWYIADATHGSLNVDGKLYSDHRYFLISEGEYEAFDGEAIEYGVYPEAAESYGYYAKNEVNGVSVTVADREQLQNLVDSFGRLNAEIDVEILFDSEYADGREAISQEIAAIVAVYNKVKAQAVFLSGNRVIITLEKI